MRICMYMYVCSGVHAVLCMFIGMYLSVSVTV